MKNKTILIIDLLLVSIIILFLTYLIIFFERKTIEISITLILLYLLILYNSIFLFYKNKTHKIKNKEDLSKIKTINELKEFELITSSTINKKTYIQPMNIIIKTNKKIKEIMKKDGWIECKFYSKHDIRLITFIKSILKKNPPITDAYFLKNPQDDRFQKDETYSSRDHIRIWKLGKTNKNQLYIAAISLDSSISIRRHNNLFVPSHSINPNVDEIRDKFTKDLKKLYPKSTIKKLKISKKKNKAKWYFTDGIINLIEIK
jgi:hypothetical protein